MTDIPFDKLHCYQRRVKGELRHGIWVMESNLVGVFFHGDHNSIDAPKHTDEELQSWTKGGGYIDTDEISAAQALQEVDGWNEATQFMRMMFDKLIHGSIEKELKTTCQ